MNISEKKESEIEQSKIELIENATLDYMNNNINSFTQTIGTPYCIGIETLENENLIPVNIDDVKEKYNYVRVVIGLNNNHSFTLVNAESSEKCLNAS